MDRPCAFAGTVAISLVIAACAFDLPEVTGGGAAGAGGGNVQTPCDDWLDVGPVLPANGGILPDSPTIATVDGRFGVAWRDSVNDIRFFTLSRDGTASPAGFNKSGLGGQQALAASPGEAPNGGVFSVASVGVDLDRFSSSGEAIGDGGSVTTNGTTHAQLTRGAGGVLLSFRDSAGVHVAWAPDGGVLGETADLGPAAASHRSWMVVAHAEGFGVLRFVGPDDEAFHSLDATGTPGATLEVEGLGDSFPAWGAELRGNLIFGNCHQLVEITPQGDVVHRTALTAAQANPLDAPTCAVASTGSELRFASVGDDGTNNVIDWRGVDPVDGLGPVLLTFSVEGDDEPNGVPAVTWDGEGFGLVWCENEIAYAHVACAGASGGGGSGTSSTGTQGQGEAPGN